MAGLIAGTGKVWKQILRMPAARKPKKAAIAYYSEHAPIDFGEDDLLIVDASPAIVSTGATSPRRLLNCLSNGATIKSFPGLHAKLIVFGETTLVVGSMNASRLSSTKLTEAALVTKVVREVDRAEKWIDRLAKSADTLTEAALRDLLPLEKKAKEKAKREAKTTGRREYRQAPTATITKEHKTFYAQVTNSQARGEDARKADRTLARMKAKRNFDIGWARFPSANAAMKSLQIGDDLFLGWQDSPTDRRIRVYQACYVRKVTPGSNNAIIFHYDYRLNRPTMSFTAFKKMLGDKTLVATSGGRIIDSNVAAEVRRKWPKR